METRTYTVYLYLYDELPSDSKKLAVHKNIDINVMYEWWETVYEDAARIGLQLTAFELDYDRHAHGKLLTSVPNVIDLILFHHGESCDTYKLALESKESYRRIASSWLWKTRKELPNDRYTLEDFQDTHEYDRLERNFLRMLLDEYALMLQNEYDDRTSEERIIETLTLNEYLFTLNGDIAE